MDDERIDEVSCFVISPIGDGQAEIGSESREVWEQSIELFEQVIEPACTALGIKPLRADQIATTGEIPEQIFTHLRDDDVVIADLTGGNANVMYELGLRHTTGKLTFQLGERGRLPFDIAAIRTIMFMRTPGGLVQARKKLTEALAAGVSTGGGAVTAARVWNGLRVERSTWLDTASGSDDSEEPGFLEKLADLESHVGNLPTLMNEVGDVMGSMTKLVVEAREKAEASTASGGPASARLYIANQVASSLDPLADKLEDISVSYQLAVEKVDPGVRYILTAEASSEADREGIVSFKETLRQALEKAAGFVDSVRTLRGQLRSSGESTRSMRRVNGKIGHALERMASSTETTLDWRELL